MRWSRVSALTMVLRVAVYRCAAIGEVTTGFDAVAVQAQ